MRTVKSSFLLVSLSKRVYAKSWNRKTGVGALSYVESGACVGGKLGITTLNFNYFVLNYERQCAQLRSIRRGTAHSQLNETSSPIWPIHLGELSLFYDSKKSLRTRENRKFLGRYSLITIIHSFASFSPASGKIIFRGMKSHSVRISVRKN